MTRRKRRTLPLTCKYDQDRNSPSPPLHCLIVRLGENKEGPFRFPWADRGTSRDEDNYIARPEGDLVGC